KNGKFLWPGYGQNIRVLEWIYQRISEENNNDNTNAKYTPIGYIPEHLNLGGLNHIDINSLFEINPNIWKEQLQSDGVHLQKYIFKFKTIPTRYIIVIIYFFINN